MGGSRTVSSVPLSTLRSVTMTDLTGLEPMDSNQSVYLGSATMADRAGLKPVTALKNRYARSATVADRVVLKPVCADTPFEQGLSISKICKICQVFLFQRPARSFFDQALGSPQASIPALTAVWIHYSKLAFECEFAKRLLTKKSVDSLFV